MNGHDGTITSATQAGRGALAVRIHPPGARPVQVVCCHLKSKLLSLPGPGGTSLAPPTTANGPGSPATRSSGGPSKRPWSAA